MVICGNKLTTYYHSPKFLRESEGEMSTRKSYEGLHKGRCDKTQQEGFAFSIISAFDSCPGSSFGKIASHCRFPEFNSARIAGSTPFGFGKSGDLKSWRLSPGNAYSQFRASQSGLAKFQRRAASSGGVAELGVVTVLGATFHEVNPVARGRLKVVDARQAPAQLA